MKTLKDLQEQYYEEFKGLPSFGPIVRNGQPNDAFELVVLKVLYGKLLPNFSKENATLLSKYIVAPPDNGIDIFFQHEDGDESSFDVIQVKNASLDENELKNCILTMERTIGDFCKSARLINSESCREMLSASNLQQTNKNKCTYYVVHTGTVDDFSGSEENEKVITYKMLNTIYQNLSDYVDRDELEINTCMMYGDPDNNSGAVVCSINGYDLAQLCNRYYNTEVGRNILFGSNLRESLITKKSKPYLSMHKTITDCPDNYWYYNNGITIIAKDIFYDKEKGKLELKEFSIVNGAQTTSALGLFLKEAKKNNEKEYINCLKKVYVLTRILKVSDETMRQDIAIYNNTQNPITSRDMVANRPEQKHLNEWLLDDTYPQIYVEIKRGRHIPANFNKSITHRRTTNEELAQLIYASFLQKPFTAKDKKRALFNNDYTQSDYIINKIYHDIFYWDESDSTQNGVVFKKTKAEIDELLFVQQLYKEAKKVMKKKLNARISEDQDAKLEATDVEEIASIDRRITTNSLHLDTVGVCMFYFVTLYYEYKAQFSKTSKKLFDYDKYYTDRDYMEEMITSAMNLFLNHTVKILVKTASENGKAGNVNNWVRSAACESAFLSALSDDLASDLEWEEKYKDFCDEYKV